MDVSCFCIVLSMVLTLATADYECLCNYEIQNTVRSEPRPGANDIGKLYEFDCKPTYQLVLSTTKWQAIQYENKVGYMPLNDKTKVQTCPGQPKSNDIVIVTSTVGTMSLRTRSSTTLDTTSRAPRTTKPTIASTTSVTSSTATSSSTTTTRMTSTSTKRSTTIRSTTGTSRPATNYVTLRRTTKPPLTTLHSLSSTTKRPTTTVRTTTKRLLHCPPQVITHGVRDHLEANGRCYEFIMTPHQNWPDAEHDCNTRGGHLVSIGSMTEQNVIYNALRRKHFYHGDKDVWIGLTDKDVENHWKWSSGERAPFTYWASGDGHGNFEDCAMLEMDRGGHWGDVSCNGFLFSTEKHGYICEYNLV